MVLDVAAVQRNVATAAVLDALRRCWQDQLVIHEVLKAIYIRMYFQPPSPLFAFKVRQLEASAEHLFSMTDPSVGVKSLNLAAIRYVHNRGTCRCPRRVAVGGRWAGYGVA